MNECMIYAALFLLIAVSVLAGVIFLIKKDLLKLDDHCCRKSFKFLLFGMEWLLTLIFVFSFLFLVDGAAYYHSFNAVAFASAWISGTADLILIVRMFFRFRKRAEMVFLLLMIPIGTVYMFLLLPDYIPDEQAHFMKAFLTSSFNFSSTYAGNVFGDYEIKGIESFHQLLHSFYFGADTTLNVPFSEACSYNFLVYIFPAAGLLIGRLLHLSIYFCYYIGRIMNFAVFLFFGYQAIRIIPRCRYLLLVFYFNPMMVQLGISYSADVIVNSICILGVAYFLYLIDKDSISERDVAVVMALIAGILVSKYVYLSVFGCYLLLIPKLLKMPVKNWVLFVGGVAVSAGLFYMTMKINAGASVVPAQEIYLEQQKVDAGKQLDWLMENPIRLLKMYAVTFRVFFDYYVESFVSHLGWLDIMINSFSYHFFYLLLFAAAFMQSSKLKFAQRLWLLVLGLLVSALVVLGLYLEWSGVGAAAAAGVQGRYFIPAVLLFLIAVSNSLLGKLRWKMELFTVSILAVQIFVLFDLFQYTYALSYLAG